MASRRGPDNSVRVAVSGTAGNATWANVFRAQLTTSSAITQSDLDAWLVSFQSAFKTLASPYQINQVTYGLAKAILYAPGGGELISEYSMSGNGTAGSDATAYAGECAVVSWLSGVYWRGGKPRTYLGPIAETQKVDEQSLTATVISNLKTSAATFRSSVNALTQGTITGTVLGFVSFRTGNAERPTPLFFAITGATVHPRIGTQRRRLGKWRS
jgi:hypothetical protein